MPLTRDEFLQQLTASSLLDAATATEFFASLPVDKQPQDGEQLARELVRQKKLTKFQAEQLYAGKGKSLTLGNYVILDKLGQGGMGMVLKAQHKRMKRLVALKVMSPAAVKTPDSLKRFHREVEAAAKLRHPNIVAADDADEAKGTHFLVMEYVEGSDLSAFVKKHGPLPVEQAVQCIIQAARGLEFAHEQGVIHRDIKPANLLIDQKGTVKILDMGLARIDGAVGGSSEGAGLTSTGTIMGTVDYMSPEQAIDTKHADARSDIYSFGCSLYYLLTGKVVYDGDTMMKKLMAHQNGAIPSLKSSPIAPRQDSRTSLDVGSSADGRTGDARSAFVSRSDTATLTALEAVFHRMIAKRPEDRQQSMTEVIAELERCQSGGSPTVVYSSQSTPGSGNALQQFLKEMSDDTPASATSGSPASKTAKPNSQTAVAEESGLAETMISSAGEAGTDPLTAQSLTIEQSERLRLPKAGANQEKKSRTVILISATAGVVLLLLVAFALTRSAGKVPVAEGGRALDPKTLKPTEGEIGIAEPMPVKAGGTLVDLPQYALDFNYQLETGNARVELPSLLRPFEPCTVEMYVTSRSVADNWDNRNLFIVGDGVQLRQQNRNWDWFTPGKDKTYDRVIVEGGVMAGRRTHLAGVSTGKELRLFIDGRLAGKTPLTGDLGVTASACLLGGPAANFEAWKPFDGLIDEVRISKVARYDQNFTPATRFDADSDTLCLYHFDEGQGDKLIDSSGNNHHGQIVGAKWVKTEAADFLRGLIAHWTFNDVSGVKAPDSSGKNHHGTIHGAVMAPGRIGSALNFDGEDDAVSYPKLGTVDDFTYSLWVKHDVAVVAGNLYAALLANDGWSKPGDVHFEYEAGAMTTFAFSTDSQRVTASGFNWSDIAGQWAHLSLVYRANAKAFNFYVNGRHYAGDRILTSALPKLQLGPGRIGHWDPQDYPDKLGRGFRGLIDDVRVYDRALSESEIRTLASATDKADGSMTAAAPPPAKAPFDAQQARAHQEAWAKHLGTTVETTNSVGAKMILIPPGEFLMGSTPEQTAIARKLGEDNKLQPDDYYWQRLPEEMPQHRVTITKPFVMGGTEVTVAQFRKFVGATNYLTDAEKYGAGDTKEKSLNENVKEADKGKNWQSPGYPISDDAPVTQISWNDACAFCAWLSQQEGKVPGYRSDGQRGWQITAQADGYRLPTEAEWEYACRAGTTTQFSFGDDATQLTQYGWFNKNANGQAQPVALKLPNAFGLHDMHGNVREWCQDYFGSTWYEQTPSADPQGPASSSHGINRVLRGGDWLSVTSNSRSALRIHVTESYRNKPIGFRVVRELGVPTRPVVNISPDRRAAEWVIAQGGEVTLSGRQGWVASVNDLPEGDLEVRLIKFTRPLSGENADLVPLRELKYLEFVGIDYTHPAAAGITALARLPKLERVSCGGQPLSDEQVTALARLNNVKSLFLAGAKLTPARCAILAKSMPQLKSLNLMNNPLLDDAALAPLGELSNLGTLQLQGTKVTAACVATLQMALPNCKIEWDGAQK